VFVTTHYMDEAEQCGRIALMRDGKLVALDTPEKLKDHAFPYGMVELEAIGQPPEGWELAFEVLPGVLSLKPHGRRWHVEPATAGAWAKLKARLPKSLKAHVIRPSLEDVFLKIVEPPKAKTARGAKRG